jgi:hypothetical protein
MGEKSLIFIDFSPSKLPVVIFLDELQIVYDFLCLFAAAISLITYLASSRKALSFYVKHILHILSEYLKNKNFIIIPFRLDLERLQVVNVELCYCYVQIGAIWLGLGLEVARE